MHRKPKLPPLPLWIFWLAVTAGLIYLQRSNPSGDRGVTNVFTGMGIVVIMGSAWVYAVCRWGSKARWRILILTLIGVACFKGPLRLVNFTGFSGVMIPEFESRFAAAGPELPSATPSASNDLGPASSADFPSFQADVTGASRSTATLSRDWNAQPPTPLWKQSVGLGWGGFSIVNGVAITLEEREEKQALIAYDLESGSVLWSHAFGAAFVNVLGGPGPRSTPTIAQGLVLAYGPRGNLACVNGKDGSLRWSHDLMAEYGVDQNYEDAHVGFGRSNSPLVVEGKVIIPAGGVDDGKQAGLVAFDLQDGKLLWESPPRQLSYSSPILAELAGVPQILVVNEDTLSAHNPENGSILWEHSWPGNTPNDANTSQPRVLAGNRVWLSKGYGLGASVIQVSLLGEHWKLETLWHNKRLLRTKFTSAIIHEGYAYGLSDGILECGDLQSGKRVWKDGRYGHGQLMLVQGMLLVLSEAGELILVEATPDKEAHELGRIQAIEGKTWNHIALAGDLILVRNGEEAALLQWATEQP